MNPVYVTAIGLAAPGLAGWDAARAVLRGDTPWQDLPSATYQPRALPANERRRLTPAIRQAFQAVEDLDRHAGERLRSGVLPSVFASSDADMAITHRICTALAQAEILVSPTDFHNSVHNAASGYWTIAAANQQATLTVAGYDGSAAVGLLESAALALGDAGHALLVAYDVPPPSPLDLKRPIHCAGSFALALSRSPDAALARLNLRLVDRADAPESACADADLERLRLGNPSLRALPLLVALAGDAATRVSLPHIGDNRLCVEVLRP